MDEYKVYPIGEVHMDEEGFFIDLDPSYRPALQALEGFSHINVLWRFSHCDMKELRCMLEAPKPYRQSPDVMGIFATRSPVRPNPIALSAAEVIHIDEERGHIQIAYIDAEDGSPVLDIKPYTPSLDTGRAVSRTPLILTGKTNLTSKSNEPDRRTSEPLSGLFNP